MPHLVQMQEEYGSRGLQVFGVTEMTREETQRFVTEHSPNYPILTGARACQDAYGVDMIWGSVVFLVDPEGIVVADELETARQAIEEAMADARHP